MANGILLYKGPSQIDKECIVVIATQNSNNHKTGPMTQTWIMRADIPPHQAIKQKKDFSICGSCPHRLHGSCYVTTFRAPLAVWNAWKRGAYPSGSSYLAKNEIRLGSYGDPAAVPVGVWEDVLSKTRLEHTGYTHLWRQANPELKKYCMASCDSIEDKDEARLAGWRTFRIRTGPDDPLDPDEMVCPASLEAGKKTTCQRCGLCYGAGGDKNIAIIVHGTQAKINKFKEVQCSPF